MRKYQNQDPREIVARFNSKCAETGQEIKRGDSCIYYPKSGEVFHLHSVQAQEYYAMKFDVTYLNNEW